jgi:hypothetical protein
MRTRRSGYYEYIRFNVYHRVQGFGNIYWIEYPEWSEFSVEDLSPSLLLFEGGCCGRFTMSLTGENLLQYKLIQVQCTKKRTP